MPPDEEPTVKMTISQAIKAGIAEHLPPAIEKAMQQHIKNCPVNDIKNDMYGNGKKGIKLQCYENTLNVKRILGIFAFIGSVILIAISWLFKQI